MSISIGWDFQFMEADRAIKRLVRRLPQVAAEALQEEGDDIMSRVLPDTPIDTGELRRSEFVQVEMHSGDPELVMGFEAQHAAPVHNAEGRVYRVGKSHFLQDHVVASTPGMLDRIALRMRARL